MSSELPNLWIRENTLSLPRAKRAMRRVGESPVRVLETNIDLPLSVNGDLNKGPNGNNRGAVHDHHHHHHDHEAEAAAPTDTMLAHHHHVKYPLPNDDDDDDDIKGKPGKLQKVAQRHGLTKKGLLLLLLVGFLCLVQLVALLVMSVLWPKDLEQLKTEVCLTPDCLRASAQLQGNLDSETWPCDNFWKYSCGGWLQDNPIPPTRSEWSIKEKLKHQALAEMRELLDTMNEPEEVNSVEWKLKTFYSSCMNIHSFMTSGLDILKRIIVTNLHGWTLMRETWDRRRWQFDVVLTRLHADYGVSPFFKVTVVPDPRREGHNIIKILPSGFSMPHRSYYDRLPNTEVEQTYKQYIKDTMKLFDATGPDALEYAAHLFHYESRIAEITPPDSVMNDPHASNNLISIGELSQIARSVPWLSLLRQMFPNSKLDHRTDVLAVSRDYFSDVSEIISTTDVNLLNNYLIFSFVTAYIPYLSSENTRVLDLFHKEFTGQQEPMERWEFCIQSTAKFFNFGLGSLYERSPNRYKARQKNSQVLHEMFNQIRYTFGANLESSRWYPLEVKSQIRAKLSNMSLAVGYPERLLNPAVIDSYYDGYTIFIKDFFKNLQDSIRSAGQQMEMKLIDPMPESGWMDALTKDDVTYVHEANKIVVPPHLLNPPLFHRNYPLAMLYGSLGVQIARAMLRTADVVGLGWNSKGLLEERTGYTNRSLDNIRSRSDCIASSVMEHGIETDAVVDRTAGDTAAEIDAVRQTYQAYLSLMKMQPQPQHPSFEALNTTNIFFMAYAGSLCADFTSQQEDIERTCNPSLMSKPRLEAVLSQMPEFSKVFSCSQESRHFPHRLCLRLH